MVTMWGWLSAATARASRWKRARRSRSVDMAAGSTLMATSRPRRGSRARKTSPMPPAPMGERISYAPSFVPGESGIRLIQFSVADQKAVKSCVTAYSDTTFQIRVWRGVEVAQKVVEECPTIRALSRQHVSNKSVKRSLGVTGVRPSGFWRRFEGRGFIRQTDGDVERSRVAPLDALVVADDPSHHDPAVQAGTVEQGFEHFLGKQGFEIEARYVQTSTVKHTIANAKIL